MQKHYWSCTAFYVIACRLELVCRRLAHTYGVHSFASTVEKWTWLRLSSVSLTSVSANARIHSLWRQQSKNVTYPSPSSLLLNLNDALCCLAMYYDNCRCSHASHTHVIVLLLGKWQGRRIGLRREEVVKRGRVKLYLNVHRKLL